MAQVDELMTDVRWMTGEDVGLRAGRRRRVICLCAQWCGTCGQYQPQFDAVAAKYPDVEFRWLDVEDEDEAMGDYEVATFPTLLISEGNEVLFLGPVLPQPAIIEQLLQRLSGGVATPGDPQAQALLKRIVEHA